MSSQPHFDCAYTTQSRRDFLRSVSIAVVGAIVATGLDAAPAFAAVVTPVKPLRKSGSLFSYPLSTRDSVSIDESNQIIIARAGGRIFAFSQKCPHKGARLEWRDDESRIFCPKHKARLDGGGNHVSGRGSRDLDRFAIRLSGQELVVDTDKLYREDENPAEWAAAFCRV